MIKLSARMDGWMDEYVCCTMLIVGIFDDMLYTANNCIIFMLVLSGRLRHWSSCDDDNTMHLE